MLSIEYCYESKPRKQFKCCEIKLIKATTKMFSQIYYLRLKSLNTFHFVTNEAFEVRFTAFFFARTDFLCIQSLLTLNIVYCTNPIGGKISVIMLNTYFSSQLNFPKMSIF